MKFIFYTHSLMSDWNHGNAHFLRGVMMALQDLGHACQALEPAESWSRANLIAQEGEQSLHRFAEAFPNLRSDIYNVDFDHARAVHDADVVIVHEWSDPSLVAQLGRLRRHGARFTLLFHDTHHRAVSTAAELAALPLGDYDGVLAFGEALHELYLAAGWGAQVFTWHEAADASRFKPHPETVREEDLVWIGNWGDGERSRELHDFLIEPARALGLSGNVFGVRYPDGARDAISLAGLRYRGWIANADVPFCFARHRLTVHVPRRPYVDALPGIPTIRVFEALACGIPLICAPWRDTEHLFRPGVDYLCARDGDEMKRHMASILAEPGLAVELARNGLATIQARHTCAHRAQELENIVQSLRADHGQLAGAAP